MFSERLKQLRIDKGITQKTIAEYLGMIPHAYQKYEYGEREPDFEKLIKLCNYYDISADWLLCRTDNPDSHKS